MVLAETFVSIDTFVQWLRIRTSGKVTRVNASLAQIHANNPERDEHMTTSVAVTTMKAAQVSEAGAGLRIIELEVPDPGRDGAHQSSCLWCVLQ